MSCTDEYNILGSYHPWYEALTAYLAATQLHMKLLGAECTRPTVPLMKDQNSQAYRQKHPPREVSQHEPKDQ